MKGLRAKPGGCRSIDRRELHKNFADKSNGRRVCTCESGAGEFCVSAARRSRVRRGGEPRTKEKVGSAVEPEWVSTVLRQLINQPPHSKHLSPPPPPTPPPLPVSALRCTAAARSPQEATG